MTQPLCLTVSLLIRSGEEAAAVAALERLALHSRREPGNLVYNVHRSLDEPRRYFIYELYRDEAALEAHRQSPHFAQHATAGLYRHVEERTGSLYAPIAVAGKE